MWPVGVLQDIGCEIVVRLRGASMLDVLNGTHGEANSRRAVRVFDQYGEGVEC